MSITKLENQIKEKKSFLCIGLDIDLNKIPAHLKDLEDPIFSFAKDIIDSTNEYLHQRSLSRLDSFQDQLSNQEPLLCH